MTEHLYYSDSFLYEFEAEVLDSAIARDSRQTVILDRTAFYPTSGGQVFDTGWIVVGNGAPRLRVAEVTEQEDGTILHLVENAAFLEKGTRVRGLIDAERRRDHMQQHSGQHVLSAAFVKLFNIPTVSFHMGTESSSIDLDTKSLSTQQREAAEALANEVVTENRPVEMRYVTQEEARGLGLRKLPPVERDQLRLIDIRGFDLSACGGTHVAGTAQIGAILLRKTEKVRQGWRVEFACGKRAVATARHDYTTLAEAASLLSSHLSDVPQQVRKIEEDLRASRKSTEHLLAEIAELSAGRWLGETPESRGRKVVVQKFADRDLTFIKLLAQKLTRSNPNVIALLASTSGQAALVFACSSGMPFDMGALMKESLEKLGGRGGGTKDMAQGGPQKLDEIGSVLNELGEKLRSS
jgi:alanyl-tRNA synthetase